MEIRNLGQKFSQKMGIADIIESKGIANIAKVEGAMQIPLSHEKILFSTISGDSGINIAQMKIISGLEKEESHDSNEQKIKEAKAPKWSYKSSLNI